MADTIEWLETIGKNANLRHAPAEELAHTLAQTDASDALKAAVMSADRSPLSTELGHKPMKTDHGTNTGAHEEDLDDDRSAPPPLPPLFPDQEQPPKN
jgi:hypothetical protein